MKPLVKESHIRAGIADEGGIYEHPLLIQSQVDDFF